MTALQKRPELDLTAHGFAYDDATLTDVSRLPAVLEEAARHVR